MSKLLKDLQVKPRPTTLEEVDTKMKLKNLLKRDLQAPSIGFSQASEKKEDGKDGQDGQVSRQPEGVETEGETASSDQGQTKMKVVDRRKTSKIDRSQILAKIQSKRQVVKLARTAAESAPETPEDAGVRTTAKTAKLISEGQGEGSGLGEGEGQGVGVSEVQGEDPMQTVGESQISVEVPTGTVVPTKKRAKKLKTKLRLKKTIRKGTITGSVADLPQDRLTLKPEERVISEIPTSQIKIGDTIMEDRLEPEREKVLIKNSSYYMNNREIFTAFVNSLFKPYRDELQDDEASALSCEALREAKTGKFSLLTHQKIVRDYLNVYTPYRGLLLYHGLGSGKTCSSVAIAEGLKSTNQVIVMTPASLRPNYISQMKFCGDSMYKKNQFWEFVDTRTEQNLIGPLSEVLQVPPDYIRKNGGAWLVNVKKPSNFESLPTSQREAIDLQINEMIRGKYRFINYNGLRNSHLELLTSNFTQNPFDNKVVIIDEAHNFVSRIVNKLKKEESLSMRLYEYLLTAQNVRIVLLTGTPVINYPNEIGILFNILRGYIKTWTIPIEVKSTRKVDLKYLRSLFERYAVLDYIDYKPSTKMLTITRNPFGFVNRMRKERGGDDVVYKGVKVDERGNISDADFERMVIGILSKADLEVMTGRIKIDQYKALPDDLETFKNAFIEGETGNVKNINMFKRRVLGLTSYFKSAQEKLMPRYVEDRDLKVIKIPMSDYQFGIYEEARADERRQETNNAKRRKKKGDGVYEDTTSTYRIFSRAFCNFVFPRPPGRPFPKEGDEVKDAIETAADEDALDATSVEQKVENVDGRYTADDAAALEKLEATQSDAGYEKRIEDALAFLKDNAETMLTPEALQTYSPKFLNILENIRDVDNVGIHLIYSQFRTLEGIGILKVILEANGFAQFKIRKSAEEQWVLDMDDEDMAKPKFALYTGTETPEEKDIILNISNSTWDNVPSTITDKLLEQNTSNKLGEVIKVFMITSSGAEGIDMRNVRFVHITEPYWHPVRTQQVIGRARRICSHEDLPEELRTVNVFIYLMTFTDEQLESDGSIELRLKDKSKVDKTTPLTSDEALFEISNIKQDINRQILAAVKESAMDCSLHSSSKDDGEPLVCYSMVSRNPNKFSYSPSISQKESDTVADVNRTTVKWKAQSIKIQGKSYAFRKDTNEVYDLDSYKQAIKIPGVNPILIGKLEKDKKTKKTRFVQY